MTVTATVGSGQTFADINAWVADVVANHTSAGALTDNVVAAVVTGEIVSTATQAISGWTPGVSNFTTTIQAGSASVGGFGGDQSFRANITQSGANPLFYDATKGAALRMNSGGGASGRLLEIDVKLCTIKYLQLRNTLNYTSTIFLASGASAANDCLIDSCIIHGTPRTGGHGVVVPTSGSTIQNCLLVDETGAGLNSTNNAINYGGGSNSNLVYSCTLIALNANNPSDGLLGSYTQPTIINTAIIGYHVTSATQGTFGAGTGNNATDLASFTQAGLNPSGQVSAVAATEFIAAGSDYRLASGSAKLKNNGASGTVPAVDIVGTSRPQGSGYCIGCWEFVVVAALPIPPFKPRFPRSLLVR